MKKQGFTLAEVLITLTIIGVVAVLTLPALMTNTNEQQSKTALGKLTNTITNAASLAQSTLMIDYSDVIFAASSEKATGDLNDEDVDDTKKTLLNLLANTANINRSIATPTTKTGLKFTDGEEAEISFKDGTSIIFGASTEDGKIAEVHDVVFDVNGAKGPNIISHCLGKTDTVKEWSSDNEGKCGEKKQRNIKDRFMMRIHSTYVTPIGAASTWALTNSTNVAESDKASKK